MSEELLNVGKVFFVTIESPYKGDNPNWADVEFNLAFLRACMRWVFDSDYIPWAGHGLYTQEGVLDDKKKEERKKGINGHISVAHKLCEDGDGVIVVMTNLGVSEGMLQGAQKNRAAGCKVFYKELPKDRFNTLCLEWDKEHLIKA
jgi:hypothetical protein